MTTEDIKLTVLATMAEATGSSEERRQLMMKVETVRYNELVRFERKKQVLLRMILYVLVGILVLTALQPLVPLLAQPQSKSPVTSTPHSADKPWWEFLVPPAKTPVQKHFP
jgi:hypothetical protein